MKKRIYKISLAFIFAVALSLFGKNVSAATLSGPTPISTVFPDTELAEKMRVHLGKTNVSDTIIQADLDAIITINLNSPAGPGNTPSPTGIKDITGLEYLNFVQTLSLSGNPFSNISVIKNNTTLKTLSFQVSDVTDISSLNTLVNLENIDGSYTKIDDLSSLQNILSLETIRFFDTHIHDVEPLKNLVNLQSLMVVGGGLYLSDSTGGVTSANLAHLSALPNLQTLNVRYQSIYDLSVFNTGFPALVNLQMGSQVVELAPEAIVSGQVTITKDSSALDEFGNALNVIAFPPNTAPAGSPPTPASTGVYNAATQDITWNGLTGPVDLQYTLSSIHSRFPGAPYDVTFYLSADDPYDIKGTNVSYVEGTAVSQAKYINDAKLKFVNSTTNATVAGGSFTTDFATAVNLASPGTYTVTINGKGANGINSAPITLTVTVTKKIGSSGNTTNKTPKPINPNPIKKPNKKKQNKIVNAGQNMTFIAFLSLSALALYGVKRKFN